MKIEPTSSATRRTVNRINEHGRFGFTLAGRKLDGEGNAQWLLRSRLTKWLGWLPQSEFVSEQEEGVALLGR